MLDNTELLALLDRLAMPGRGRKLVQDARIKAPVREAVSRGGNVVTLLASRKMRRDLSLRTESKDVEFAAAVGYEHDAGVLEYYTQPCELKLELVEDATGEIHRIHHFPDFLVIRADRVTLVEWKTEARLRHLAQKTPWRYIRDEDGRWSAPLIERQLAEWGLGYEVHSGDQIPRRRVENLLALEDYFHPGAEPCPEAVLQRVHAALQADQALYLADLYAEPLGFKPDQIFKAIADQLLVADLVREPLTEPRRCRVYRDEAVRELLAGYMPEQRSQTSYELDIKPGTAFAFDGQRYTITLVGEKNLVLTDADGKQSEVSYDWIQGNLVQGRIVSHSEETLDINQQLSRYSEAELRTALKRQSLLQSETEVSDRTLRRWRERETAARLNGDNEVLALVPRTRDRGNRLPRLSGDQEELLMRVIQKEWLTHQAQNYKSCYRHAVVAFDSAGLEPPSYPTLIARIQALDHEHATRLRHGKRRAYQEGGFVQVLAYDTPVHGSRPFQYCHIDHTQLDIELICSRTGANLGRPWFSLAVDSFTRRILGIYLSFDPPSYVASMMVLRDIVRRHQRLPQFLVLDNGADFRSVSLEQLLKVLGIHLRFRPAGHPRHGAVMERLFGRAHSEYVHNLAGNTKATKNVRMTTGKYLPRRLAEWTLEAMYYGLEHWAFDYYDQAVHPALGLSPRETHAKGIADSGARSHTHLVCNSDFLIATCPRVDRTGTRKVDRQRGVKVNDQHYWAPAFKDLKVAGTQVPVRYDPWDHSTVYAEVDRHWVRCVSHTLAALGPMTVAEREALAGEYRQRTGQKPDAGVSIQRLQEFLQTFTPEGAMALHLKRQAENKSLYGGLGQAWISPPLPAPRPMATPFHEAPAGPTDYYPTGTPSCAKDDDLPEFDTF